MAEDADADAGADADADADAGPGDDGDGGGDGGLEKILEALSPADLGRLENVLRLFRIVSPAAEGLRSARSTSRAPFKVRREVRLTEEAMEHGEALKLRHGKAKVERLAAEIIADDEADRSDGDNDGADLDYGGGAGHDADSPPMTAEEAAEEAAKAKAAAALLAAARAAEQHEEEESRKAAARAHVERHFATLDYAAAVLREKGTCIRCKRAASVSVETDYNFIRLCHAHDEKHHQASRLHRRFTLEGSGNGVLRELKIGEFVTKKGDVVTRMMWMPVVPRTPCPGSAGKACGLWLIKDRPAKIAETACRVACVGTSYVATASLLVTCVNCKWERNPVPPPSAPQGAINFGHGGAIGSSMLPVASPKTGRARAFLSAPLLLARDAFSGALGKPIPALTFARTWGRNGPLLSLKPTWLAAGLEVHDGYVALVLPALRSDPGSCAACAGGTHGVRCAFVRVLYARCG